MCTSHPNERPIDFTQVTLSIEDIGGNAMKNLVAVVCAVAFALGLSGCIGKGPIGKGKVPVDPGVKAIVKTKG